MIGESFRIFFYISLKNPQLYFLVLIFIIGIFFDRKVVADINPNKAWCPSTYTAFKVLLSARLCAAVWSNISDCDEVFNYWEPVRKYFVSFS